LENGCDEAQPSEAMTHAGDAGRNMSGMKCTSLFLTALVELYVVP
jgi:hypothetical protein